MAVASIAIPADAARDFRAKALVKQVGSWPKLTLKQPHGSFPAGTVFRRAYGSNGARYLVNSVVCECPDYTESSNICKHIRALVMWEAQQQSGSAQEADPTLGIRIVRGRYEDLWPACPCGDLADGPDGLCSLCSADRVWQQEMTVKQAIVAGGR